jgi:hypothetical protein
MSSQEAHEIGNVIDIESIALQLCTEVINNATNCVHMVDAMVHVLVSTHERMKRSDRRKVVCITLSSHVPHAKVGIPFPGDAR